jgi:hypothetical protein
MMSTLIRKRLVDELIDAYVAWREACVRVDDASRSCPSETGARARVALGLYLAALDAEERAAEVYAGLVRRANELSWSEDPPTEPFTATGL